MSQSRLEKVGTVYSRMRALLDSGARRPEFRPLWVDVYEAHPPRLEPRWDRPGRQDPLPRIVYPEDRVRAQFFRQFGERSEAHDLMDRETRGLAQSFVERFAEVERDKRGKGEGTGTMAAFEEVFALTVDSMELDGVKLRGMDPDGAKAAKWADDRTRVGTRRGTREEEGGGRIRHPSFRELFSKGSEEQEK